MIDMAGVTSVREQHLASEHMAGNRALSTAARLAALDLMLDELGAALSPAEADMLINYVAYRYERGEIEGARKSLMHYVDLTGTLRLEAVLHTEGR